MRTGRSTRTSCGPSPLTPDEDGKIDPDKLRPITFDPIHQTYRALGEKVGNAFQDGAKLK